MTIRDWPKLDRPREKLARYGVTRLSTTELLAILIGSGFQGQSAIEIAQMILKKFSSDRLATVAHKQLIEVAGLGPTKASIIMAALELGRRLLKEKPSQLLFRPKDVWAAMRDIRDQKKERCVVFFLDGHRQTIEREIISVGTVNASLVHPREVFEPAIKYLASQIIVAHNHPSGNLEPSADDLFMTERLVESGKILGIEVIDHVIVTGRSHFSLKEKGMLSPPSSN